MKIIDIYDNGGYASLPDRMICDRLRLMEREGQPIGALRRKGPVADCLAGQSGIDLQTSDFGAMMRLFTFPMKIRRLCGDSDRIIIHTYRADHAERALLVARSMSERDVKVVLEQPSGLLPPDTPAARFTLSNIDGLIFHTAFDRDRYAEAHATGVAAMTRCEVIAPGISIPDKPVAHDDSRELVVIWGGRITAGCGLDHVIEAMGMTHHTPVKLIVAGQGEARQAMPLVRRAKALGIEARVEWLGDVALTPESVMKADALVIPDGESPTAVESGVIGMACGMPLIVAAGERMQELAQDGVNAMFYDSSDPENLAAVFRTLAGKPERRRELGKGARAKAEAQYDLRFAVSRLNDFYTSLMA